MFEDLMHLTASLDLRAQSERCVSTIIFYACASSGVAGGGYAAAICGRAPLEKVRQAHTGPSTRSVRDMRMSEKVASTTLKSYITTSTSRSQPLFTILKRSLRLSLNRFRG